ncbi:usherin [Astyanax mexicanus]|nr:usherin [Astyanax mexicanus]
MAGVSLVLLAVFLAVVLHKALNRPPFTRERPPIVPLHLQHRSPSAVYPPSNSYLFDTVPDTTSSPNSVMLKSFTMHLEEVVDSKVLEDGVLPEGEMGVVTVSTVHMSTHGLTQNPLRRSVSQLIDRKGREDDEVWDPHFRAHDSGMFDEEFVDTVKGFSTVRKEHTMFTDTNL